MPQDLDLAALRCFVIAVRVGSIGRAALELGRTQPAVSQQLRRLEDVIGCRLLERSAKGVRTTREGDALLNVAVRMLELSDEVQTRVRSRVIRAKRSIGLIEDLATSGLQAFFVELCRLQLDLEPHFVVASSGKMRDAFASGSIDLLLTDSYCAAAPRRQSVCPLAWVAAPGLDLSLAPPTPLILFVPPCEWRVHTLKRLEQAGMQYRILFESESLAAVQAAVRQRIGVATLLPGNIEEGMMEVDASSNGLPIAPDAQLRLYRRSGLQNDAQTDLLEELLWKTMAGRASTRSALAAPGDQVTS